MTAATATDAAHARMRRLTGYGLAMTGAVLFSSKAIIIKAVYGHGVDAETLMALRMLLSLPIYLGVGLWTWWRSPVTLTPGLVLKTAVVGMIGYWVASYTDFLGLKQVSATFERLILFTYPLFVVLLGALFFGGKVRGAHILAFVVAYSGLALIFLVHPADPGGSLALGALLVTVAAISFALYQLLAKPLIGMLGPQLFTSLAMVGATVVTLAVFFLHHGVGDLAVSPEVLHGALLLAFAATILPTFAMSAALARISAEANSAIGMVSPVATIILAEIFLGEQIGLTEGLGALLVMSGVAVFVLGERRG